MEAAFGVVDGATLNVYQLLKAVDRQAVSGVLYNGDPGLEQLAQDLFERLNQAGNLAAIHWAHRSRNGTMEAIRRPPASREEEVEGRRCEPGRLAALGE